MTQEKNVQSQDTGTDPQCIQCGRCLEVCPLFSATQKEELSPRGRMLLLERFAETPELFSEKKAASLAASCLTCGRCHKACPRNVDVPHAVARVRAEHAGIARRLWKVWIESSALSWPLFSRMAKLAAPVCGKGDSRIPSSAKKLAALAEPRKLAGFLRPESAPACQYDRKAVVFPGCLAQAVTRRWTSSAEKLLEFLGVETAVRPKWDCCGASLGHAGAEAAQKNARAHNVELWREAGEPLLVIFCASCHAGLAAYATCSSLFRDRAEAERFAESLLPLSSLCQGMSVEQSGDMPSSLVYHHPCHAPDGDPDAVLLHDLLGQSFRQPDAAECCGMGGILQLTAPELSATVGKRCWEGLLQESPSCVLTGCSGCYSQLAGTAPEGVTVAHWLDMFDL